MSKRIIEGKIIENKEVATDIYKLVAGVAEGTGDVRPGQFVNVYLEDKSMLLPRPISICSFTETTLTLVYKVVGKGTKELSGYRQGQPVSISTSLGNGFQMDRLFSTLLEANPSEEKTIALIGGGVGVPPLLSLAEAIKTRQGDARQGDGSPVSQRQGDGSPVSQRKQRGGSLASIKVIAIIGFLEEPFLVPEFQDLCDEVHIATDKGTVGFHGTVLELIKQKNIRPDYCLACGPKPMLKALGIYCENNRIPLQVSMEERMGCGYGACVGCTCKTKEESNGKIQIVNKKVCKDGPVFMGNEVAWDE